MTLKQAIEEYSADAMRFAMANAGDGMDDANFEHAVANAGILTITKELSWIEEVRAVCFLRQHGLVLGDTNSVHAFPVAADPCRAGQLAR